MSEDQLRRIFAEGQPDWLEMPAKDGLSGQDVVDLLDTQTFFELLKLPYPSDAKASWSDYVQNVYSTIQTAALSSAILALSC